MKTLISILLLFGFINQSHTQPVWNLQNSGTTSNLNRIFLKYTKAGQVLFIVGDNGVILKTTNSGLIWETVNSNTTADLYDIDIVYSDTGYAVGSNGTIIKTTDDGDSWFNSISNTTNSLKDLRIINSPIKAIAVGENGTLLKLQNNLWMVSQIDTTDFNSVTSDIGIDRMIIVGNYGSIIKTTNSGINWNHINSGVTNNLNYISQNIVIGDNGTALQVNINSNNVIIINSGTFNNLKGLYNIFGYKACGSNGTILNYWQPVNSNTSINLNSIIQTTIDNCFVVGNNGTILYTNTFYLSPSSKQLNANNISTWFFNNGIFNHHPTSIAGFEWPKGQNKYARYTSGSLIGAIVNNDTLVTVCDYTSEYFPGQTINGIPQGNTNPDFRVYRLVYNVNDSERTKWPNSLLGNSDQGAPVYFDSLTMNWKPSDYGNQTMFYSYTDSYDSSHTNHAGKTAPLKADIKQIIFSFNQPEELRNIIYQEYRIINRSSDVWTNAYINLYTDDDLGEASDDAEGVDTSISLTYTYNFDNNDGIYGTAPPSVGFQIIRSPVQYTGNNNDTIFYYEGKSKRIKIGYKEIGLGSTVIFHDDGLQPSNYRESYNTIKGLQKNGNQYINPITNLPTKFVYSGDPVANTGWNQNVSSDVRFYQGFGPLNMSPGDTQIIVIAQVIARGLSNRNSITKLREASLVAKEYYDNCFSNVVIGINNITTSTPENFYLYQNYPNPFNPATVISYQLPVSNFVILKVYDAVGKEVAILVNEKQTAGKYSVTFNGNNFSSGIYFYSIIAGHFKDTKKIMLIK